MNKKIVLAIVVLVILGLIFYLESKKVHTPQLKEGEEIIKVNSKDPVKILDGVSYDLSPEFVGIADYLNIDEEIKISDFEGNVVLIDFWTYSCINCIRTLPYLTSWHEKYKDRGLTIIGVHAPEFEFEKKKENVIEANERYGIEYPVVLDNNRGTWNAFKNRFWPAKYLIDSEGYVRYEHFGEGAYEETELKIQELLAEAGENSGGIALTEEEQEIRYKTTPELYAGVLFAFPRNQFIGNKKLGDRLEDFVLPGFLNLENTIYLSGLWYYNEDNLHLQGEDGGIALEFTASEVNIVADPLGPTTEMEILIDGQYVKPKNAGEDVRFDGDRTFVVIDQARLYNIYDGTYGQFRLDLKVEKDFSFNAFTFG
jgi:thiol-disulfide isomerase/thioredoxin